MAIKRRDFLKASAAAGAAVTLEGAGEVLKGAEDNKDKVYILPNMLRRTGRLFEILKSAMAATPVSTYVR